MTERTPETELPRMLTLYDLMAMADLWAAARAMPDSKAADAVRIRTREVLREALSSLLQRLSEAEARCKELEAKLAAARRRAMPLI